MARKLKHQTKLQYLARVREAYRVSVKLETCRLAHAILKDITDGEYSIQEMRHAWNMSPSDWTIHTAALQAKANKYTTYLTALSATNNEAGN